MTNPRLVAQRDHALREVRSDIEFSPCAKNICSRCYSDCPARCPDPQNGGTIVGCDPLVAERVRIHQLLTCPVIRSMGLGPKLAFAYGVTVP